MYCVRCGVKLEDGAKECPLCRTPVLIAEDDVQSAQASYSEKYPSESTHAKYVGLGLVTAAMIAACLVAFIICIKTFGAVSWSGYVMLGIALAWITLVLPFWFRRADPFIFVPIDFAAIAGYLLYICLYNGQNWFLGFAFPVTMLACVLTLAAMALYRFVKKGKLFISGGLLIAFGLSFILVEFFQHITFEGTGMFVWSLYPVCGFSALGIFILIAAIIKPLREYLERKFFI